MAGPQNLEKFGRKKSPGAVGGPPKGTSEALRSDSRFLPRPPTASDTSFQSAIATPPLSDPKPANDDIKAEEKPTASIAAEKPANIHAWEHTADPGKLTTAYRVLEASGAGVAFTLNLGPAEIIAAQRHPKGFVDYFKRPIDRALRRALGYVPLYGFGVDVARDDRPHFHGADRANDNQLEAINGALCHAAGKWANPRHGERQCELERLYTPHIWANYCLRNQAKVKRLIRGRDDQHHESALPDMRRRSGRVPNQRVLADGWTGRSL